MKIFHINNDIIEEVEVSVSKKSIVIYGMYDGLIVEKLKIYTPLLNIFHLEAYLEELVYGTSMVNEILDYIKSKIK